MAKRSKKPKSVLKLPDIDYSRSGRFVRGIYVPSVLRISSAYLETAEKEL